MFQATTGNLILKPTEKEIKTESGLFIASDSAEISRSIRGEVIATGGKKVLGNQIVNMEAKVGDTVLFDTYKSSELTFEGKVYYKIEEDKIFGIILKACN